MPVRVATVRAADVPASQTDFTFYVDLGRVGATALTLAEANSSRWYTDTDLVTEMAREIVSLTEGHGKYGTLTSTSKVAIDYDGIRADYAVGATFGRNNVWTAYSLVFHGDTTLESTGNNSITHTNVSNVTGKIGQAFEATGATTSYSTITTSLGSVFDGNFTVQQWVNVDVRDEANGNVWMWAGTRNMQFIDIDLGKIYLNSFNAGSSITISTGTVALSTWTMVHMQRTSGTTGKISLQGADSTSATATVRNPAGTLTQAFRLFSRQDNLGGNADGRLDEVRISSTVFSTNWITTEYNNQNDEATFWGTWTTFGGGAVPRYLTMMGVG